MYALLPSELAADSAVSSTSVFVAASFPEVLAGGSPGVYLVIKPRSSPGGFSSCPFFMFFFSSFFHQFTLFFFFSACFLLHIVPCSQRISSVYLWYVCLETAAGIVAHQLTCVVQSSQYETLVSLLTHHHVIRDFSSSFPMVVS